MHSDRRRGTIFTERRHTPMETLQRPDGGISRVARFLVYVLTRDNWDLVRYYPHPRGRRGTLYDAGLLTGTSAHDAHWFAPTPAGERALRRLLARHGIHLR